MQIAEISHSIVHTEWGFLDPGPCSRLLADVLASVPMRTQGAHGTVGSDTWLVTESLETYLSRIWEPAGWEYVPNSPCLCHKGIVAGPPAPVELAKDWYEEPQVTSPRGDRIMWKEFPETSRHRLSMNTTGHSRPSRADKQRCRYWWRWFASKMDEALRTWTVSELHQLNECLRFRKSARTQGDTWERMLQGCTWDQSIHRLIAKCEGPIATPKWFIEDLARLAPLSEKPVEEDD